MDSHPRLAIIGGSGLYSMPGLSDVVEHDVETPFGKPSDPVVVGTLTPPGGTGMRVAFLARHGIGHRILPSEVNYRANIFALKMLGVERVVSVSACGSLREDFAPGHIVVPDQLFDLTRDRARTFFGEGLVAHTGVAEPFCPDLSEQVHDAVAGLGVPVHRGGPFLTIEGPRFSTKIESQTYRSWGMSIIGMTASPEAFLAKEAEMCYACMAHVTDYDVWHVSEAPVTAEIVIRTLNENVAHAQRAILNLVAALRPERACDCEDTLAAALVTARERIPDATLQRLKPIVGKYLA